MLLGLTTAGLPLKLGRCTKAGGCETEENQLTLDHYMKCSENCNYEDYGIKSTGDGEELSISLVNPKSIGSRSYMMNKDENGEEDYTTFKLLN